jgi:hypothetical protein
MNKPIVITLLAITLLSSCKKKETTPETIVTNPASGTTPITTSSEEYIKFNLNGVSYNIKQSASGGLWYGGAGTSIYSTSSLIVPNVLIRDISYYNASLDVFKFSISDTTRETGLKPSDNAVRNLTQKRNLNYENEYPTTTSPACRIQLKDNFGVWWSSSKYAITGSGKSFQSSSIYSINEVMEDTFIAINPDDLSLKRVFKASFNCKVYNSVGDSLLLTDGEMILSVPNFK